jgi:ATP-binding protein involved in chromosome partitioning
MSAFPCPTCGKSISLFGTGGGEETARRLSELVGTNVPLLGKIPFSPDLRTGGDSGKPVVAEHPEAAASVMINEITDQLIVRSKSLLGVRLGLAT